MRKNMFALIIEDITQKPVCYAIAFFSIVVGIFCGAFYPAYLSGTESTSMAQYLASLMRAFSDASPNILSTLLQSLWNNGRIILIMGIAGITRFGSPFVVIAGVMKGFGVGVAFGAISAVYGVGGFFFALLIIVPQNLFYIPAYSVLGARALSASVSKFNMAAKHNQQRYISSILPCFYAIACGIVIESLMMPFIIKIFCPWFL